MVYYKIPLSGGLNYPAGCILICAYTYDGYEYCKFERVTEVGSGWVKITESEFNVRCPEFPAPEEPVVVTPINKGGTGATTAAAARANLGTSSVVAIYGVAVTFADSQCTYTHPAIRANSVVIVQRRSGIAGAATTGMFATTSYDGYVMIVADNASVTAANLNIVIINP